MTKDPRCPIHDLILLHHPSPFDLVTCRGRMNQFLRERIDREFMRDQELVLEILRQIEDAAGKIVTRFRPIQQVSDCTDSGRR